MQRSKLCLLIFTISAFFVGIYAEGVRVGAFQAEVRSFFGVAEGLPSEDVLSVSIIDGAVYARTTKGTAKFSSGRWSVQPSVPELSPPKLSGLDKLLAPGTPIRCVAASPDGRVAAAAPAALFLRDRDGRWQAVYPAEGNRSWAPQDIRAIAFDSRGRFWFAAPQGVGCLDSMWKLYGAAEGLPYSDFTAAAAGENGVVWFGTRRGAIRFDGQAWEYRQGLRWLPHDEVRSIAVEANGNAWFATPRGVGRIERRPITLAEKARFFEDEIDRRHRRTEHGYVMSVVLKQAGNKEEWIQRDSDNDGLWTAMYGAGQCYAWAATGSVQARKNAEAAFNALRFLGQVTQGGSHPAPRGFVARAILPTSGPDPNRQQYTRERDEEARAKRDHLWKVIVPRWPRSADGRWYWKCDTSSDELDGHFFFYALYFDLVASAQEEKQQLRDHVAAIVDHLIAHDYQFVDHDGKPTRWGIFNPENLNQNPDWREERGINSLSMLSYLKVAEHVTGNMKYREAARELIENHAYAMNTLITKTNAGPGAGNQSDDEMIFMNFFNLIRYETDPGLKQIYALGFHNHWIMEKPEMNPLFNFMYAACNNGQVFSDAFGKQDLSPAGDWMNDALDTLRRYPLDRVNWRLTNSHRQDILSLPAYAREGGAQSTGYRRNGKVLPIDERFVEHWNHDPWQLDQGGDGRILADGNSFLLPYYMGLYYKFFIE